MIFWQKGLIILFFLLNLLIFFKGCIEVKVKRNPFGLTRLLFFLGIFVWGDALVFSLFWAGASLITLFLSDWFLFLLIISIFWAVRGFGESSYWINQQFSTVKRNPPQKLLGYQIFNNDSLWFAYQIFWQCLTVIAVVFSIYLANKWLIMIGR